MIDLKEINGDILEIVMDYLNHKVNNIYKNLFFYYSITMKN